MARRKRHSVLVRDRVLASLVDGMRPYEAAERFGVPPGTVRRWRMHIGMPAVAAPPLHKGVRPIDVGPVVAARRFTGTTLDDSPALDYQAARRCIDTMYARAAAARGRLAVTLQASEAARRAREAGELAAVHQALGLNGRHHAGGDGAVAGAAAVPLSDVYLRAGRLGRLVDAAHQAQQGQDAERAHQEALAARARDELEERVFLRAAGARLERLARDARTASLHRALDELEAREAHDFGEFEERVTARGRAHTPDAAAAPAARLVLVG